MGEPTLPRRQLLLDARIGERRLLVSTRSAVVMRDDAAGYAPAQLGAVVLLPRRAAVHDVAEHAAAEVPTGSVVWQVTFHEKGSSEGTTGTWERKQGLTKTAGFQDMCDNINSASMVQWEISLQKNRFVKKDSSGRLCANVLNDFKESCIGVKTSCLWHFVFTSSAQVALLPSIRKMVGNSTARHIVLLLLFLQPKCGPFLDPSSIHLAGHQESYHCFQRSFAANLTVDSPQNIGMPLETQQTDERCTSNTESQMVPVFIKHCSGEVVLVVKLDMFSEHMMCLFQEKTKMELVHQYFVYRNNKIHPKRSLLSYGVGRDATIHVCTRLLGGNRPTLEEYFNTNKDGFLMEVILPDGTVSLEMTEEACRIVSTWLDCFIWAFSQGKSWGGEFTLTTFYVVDCHVLFEKSKGPKGGLGDHAMDKDITLFVKHVKRILCRKKRKLVSEYPPFLRNLTVFLESLRLTTTISDSDKLIIQTHMSCTTSSSWGLLLLKLHRRYNGLSEAEKFEWDTAINGVACRYGWRSDLSKMEGFKEMFGDENSYGNSNIGAFMLMRDLATHGLDYKVGVPKIQNGDKLLLMIPVHMGDFLPNIIEKMIKRNIDISTELMAAKIRCFCAACAPPF